MSISDTELTHLEQLARISIEASERQEMRRDLGAVLGYFDSLSQLDTEGVEELVRPVPLTNVLRSDQVQPSLPQAVALALAVEHHDGFIKVPRTVEGDD